MSLKRWVTLCIPVETEDHGASDLDSAVDFSITTAAEMLASEGWDVDRDTARSGWTNISDKKPPRPSTAVSWP